MILIENLLVILLINIVEVYMYFTCLFLYIGCLLTIIFYIFQILFGSLFLTVPLEIGLLIIGLIVWSSKYLTILLKGK